MPPDSAPQFEIFASAETMQLGAAERIAHSARAAVYNRKKFRLVLAGGEGMRPIYERLAEEYRERIQWQQTVVFFSDEKCVPGPNPESNYSLAAGSLISRVPVAKRNEHRISGELDAESASRTYEKDLRKHFPVLEDPAFDLLLLYVGEDGSVASLFPGSPAFTEPERWVLPVRAPASQTTPERITLTPRILNRSREVLLLAPGKGRMEIARRIQAGDPAALELPAAKIRGTEGTVWLTTASP